MSERRIINRVHKGKLDNELGGPLSEKEKYIMAMRRERDPDTEYDERRQRKDDDDAERERLTTEIEAKLAAKPETGEQWADICALEERLMWLGGPTRLLGT